MMPIERRKSQQPFSGPDRRRPGRPPLTEEERAMRPKPRPVRLEMDVENAFCRISHHHGISIHALLRLAARRLTEDEARGTLDLTVFSVDE